MNIFGRKTARDQLKESQKDVKGNLRDLERDMAVSFYSKYLQKFAYQNFNKPTKRYRS